jgi:orotate phosphoribosyltransferase-like protein
VADIPGVVVDIPEVVADTPEVVADIPEVDLVAGLLAAGIPVVDLVADTLEAGLLMVQDILKAQGTQGVPDFLVMAAEVPVEVENFKNMFCYY